MRFLLFRYLSILSFVSVPLICYSSNEASPFPAQYFDEQIVDHVDEYPNPNRRLWQGKTWSQRYYTSSKYFSGPGHPIFLIMGGEAAANYGIYYPFISEHLAKDFGAFVLQPEHRFYGKSIPLPSASNEELSDLMTPEQSMLDAVRLLRHIQTTELNCSTDRSSPEYCPVITVGGSYPGFLSAMMRVLHPDVVDMAYAASAPMGFYAQTVDADAYYDLITAVAEKSSLGCSDAVRETLQSVTQIILDDEIENNEKSFHDLATKMGICSIPEYIQSSQIFQEELMMVVGYTFADLNMWNYPPGKNTDLYNNCQIFQSSGLDEFEKMKIFLSAIRSNSQASGDDLSKTPRFFRAATTGDDSNKNMSNDPNCIFNMSNQVPAGANGTISSGDWSGVGTGNNGKMWDFQTCTLLVEKIGFSEQSMFPQRDWTMDWLQEHCRTRFGVTPDPYYLRDKWHFQDLVHGAKASRIIFTNGMNDGWSVSGVKENLSEDILALNLINGAHHSDLSAMGPSDIDTDDVKDAFIEIHSTLSRWIQDVKQKGILSPNTRSYPQALKN